jgi:signal peptidase I
MKRPRAWFLAAALGAALGCEGSVSSGDRVLVSKSQYETHIQEPQRFDVVVFKFPKGPIENNTPKNYIKRLLGLPGEILAIFFGRLFHFPAPGGVPPFKDHEDPAIDPKTLWHKVRENDELARKLFEEGACKIVRKTPDVMMALRRIVYDNDFQPKSRVQFPRWDVKDTGWTADKQRGFAHAGAKGDAKVEQVDWLRYRHLNWFRDGIVAGNDKLKRELITDVMGYNAIDLGPEEARWTPNWVGDLMLECNVEATKGEGEFVLELSKGIHRFQARWDLGSGVCTLFKDEVREVDEGGKRIAKLVKRVELDSKPTKLRGPGSYQVRFANIDARLTVWVDKELPFGDGKDYPPPEVRNGVEEKDLDEITLQQRRGPTENDLEPASIGSKGGAVKIQHLRLWRDTYYSLRPGGMDIHLIPGDLSDPDRWEQFKKMEYKTLYVQPGHYLCLGDNSQASSDSRDWGLVPERLMLGRALLVYYPFHRAGAIR